MTLFDRKGLLLLLNDSINQSVINPTAQRSFKTHVAYCFSFAHRLLMHTVHTTQHLPSHRSLVFIGVYIFGATWIPNCRANLCI